MQIESNAGMPLARALRIERGAIVSFVGAGGKTTSMFRLAAELRSEGMRVVATTTTHISEDQARIATVSIHPENLDELGGHLDRHRHCLIVGPPDGKGRVEGVSKEFIARLQIRSDVDVILIEADGSRSRPFKAPGEHEPVVSELTTILVPIAGLNAIGLALNEDNVHRAEIIAALAKEKAGAPISAETIARILSHPLGGAKYCPAGARLIPLLNKADAHCDMLGARQAAERLIEFPNVDSVAISSMKEDPPVREVWAPVAGLVLAAGQASRFGATKQILPWQDTTLAAHSARAALDAGLDPVIVALGYDAENVAKALAGLPVRLVHNPEFKMGQSTSIRKSLEALPSRTCAAVFLLADHPFASPSIVKALVEAHRRTPAPACGPVFEGKRGNPALFDKALFNELRGLSGDVGGRVLLEKYQDKLVAVPAGPDVLLDIDTREDCERLKKIGTLPYFLV
jgi:molybdenum cofactor cytidylyltransferase